MICARPLLALAITLLSCACTHKESATYRVEGDTPTEVAISILELKTHLDDDKKASFAQAITSLTMVTPDKKDDRTVGIMSPAFARMVQGRTADEIIQLATTYRLSIPSGR